MGIPKARVGRREELDIRRIPTVGRIVLKPTVLTVNLVQIIPKTESITV